MSGLSFVFQKGDGVSAIVNRVLLVYVVHYATIHQRSAFDPTDKLPGALWVLCGVLALYYLETTISKGTDPGLVVWRDYILYLLALIQTWLHYLMLAVTDALLAPTVDDAAPLTFITVARPVAMAILLAGILGLLKHFFGKKREDKK